MAFDTLDPGRGGAFARARDAGADDVNASKL